MSGTKPYADEADRIWQELVAAREEQGPLQVVDREQADRELRQRHEQAARADAAERRARKVRSILEQKLPPRLFELITAPDFQVKNQEAVDIIEGWLSGRRSVLLLRGEKGNGKTTGVGLGIKGFLESSPYLDPSLVSWHTPDQFISAVLHSYDDRSPRLGTRLVAVDDIGEETRPDELGAALKRCMDDGLPRIMLTCNLKLETFLDRYKNVDRLMDRLDDEGATRVVRGPSLRTRTGGFAPPKKGA